MRRLCFLIIVLFALAAFGADADPLAAAKDKQWLPVDVGPFMSSAHHARMKFKGEKPPYALYEPEQIAHITQNVLAFQNGDGGWPKNVDLLRVYPEAELKKLPNGREGEHGDTSTFDNDTTWSQIGYLAQVYQQTRLKCCAYAAMKGIDYTLREQRGSGGWRGADIDAVTFNDGVMYGVMHLLKAVIDDKGAFGFVDNARRTAANKAFDKGVRCILGCQIKVGDRLTAWCQQHDHKDLKPIWARAFEPPSITPGESADIVRLLMSIEKPSAEIAAAIDAAVAWFELVKIEGVRIDKVAAEPTAFRYHYSDFDFVEVKDPQAPPIWARYYDLEKEIPIFCDRGHKIVYSIAELGRERRTGYAWYGHSPAAILETEYPAWKKKQGR